MECLKGMHVREPSGKVLPLSFPYSSQSDKGQRMNEPLTEEARCFHFERSHRHPTPPTRPQGSCPGLRRSHKAGNFLPFPNFWFLMHTWTCFLSLAWKVHSCLNLAVRNLWSKTSAVFIPSRSCSSSLGWQRELPLLDLSKEPGVTDLQIIAINMVCGFGFLLSTSFLQRLLWIEFWYFVAF